MLAVAVSRRFLIYFVVERFPRLFVLDVADVVRLLSTFDNIVAYRADTDTNSGL